jgi:hypothetical protein
VFFVSDMKLSVARPILMAGPNIPRAGSFALTKAQEDYTAGPANAVFRIARYMVVHLFNAV